jgi:6-phosphogluconolactonase
MAAVEPDVRVFLDLPALHGAAADIFVEASARATAERGRFLVCLSGGSSPSPLYSLLAESPYRDLVSWPSVHVFWCDERCVPAEDLSSNYRQARELLLSRVPVAAHNIHRVRTELDPELAAADYALMLRKFADPPLAWPRLDMVLLGLGTDGHTASLFPGSPLGAAESTWAVSAPANHPGTRRVTLTVPVFNAARRVVFLVHGTGKAGIVASVLYGDAQPALLPAQRIRPDDGELIWLLDTSAAAGT